MADFQLTPRAEEDLEAIWDYTAQTWSVTQADKYVDSIFDMIEQLAANPKRGRSADDVRQGYRKQAVGAHLLFYRELDDGLEIVRILHARMDIFAQFNDDQD